MLCMYQVNQHILSIYQVTRHILCMYQVTRHILCMYQVTQHILCMDQVTRNILCMYQVTRHILCMYQVTRHILCMYQVTRHILSMHQVTQHILCMDQVTWHILCMYQVTQHVLCIQQVTQYVHWLTGEWTCSVSITHWSYALGRFLRFLNLDVDFNISGAPILLFIFDYSWPVLMNWDETMLLVSWHPALPLLHRPLSAQSSCVFQWVRNFFSALYRFWSCFTLKMHYEVAWWFYWSHLVINIKVTVLFKK